MSAAAPLRLRPIIHLRAKSCVRVIHTICIMRLGIMNFLGTSAETLLQASQRHDEASGDCPPPLLSMCEQCRPRATGDSKTAQISLVKQVKMTGRHRTNPASHLVW
eukprot:scaffold355414_cov15-Prasinocladus_malaysianus.AAC.1